MKKISIRLCSGILSVLMIMSMMSCLFGITASATEIVRDSGNMPVEFFNPENYNHPDDPSDDNPYGDYTIANIMSDGGIRFIDDVKYDLGSTFENSSFSFDAKFAGSFNIVLRTDKSGTDGYVLGYGVGNNFMYLNKLSTGKIAAYNNNKFDNDNQIIDFMKWHRYTIEFIDREGCTEIIVSVDGKRLPFGRYATFVDSNPYSVESDEVGVVEGKIFDYNPIRTGTYMQVNPNVPEQKIALKNMDSAVFMRSVDADLTGKTDPYRITFIGDSITHGASVSHDDTLSRFLNDKLGYTYDCYNAGVSAAAAFEGAGYGFPYRLEGQNSIAKHTNADLYILMLGTNDSKYIKNYSDNVMFTGADLENWHTRFLKEYGAIIDGVKDTGGQVILCVPPWNYSWATESNPVDCWTDETICKIGEWVKELATNYGVPYYDYYTLTKDHYDWFADRLHPNAGGNYQMIEGFYSWLVNKSGVSLTKTAEKTYPVATEAASDIYSTVYTDYDGVFTKEMFNITSASAFVSFPSNGISHIDGAVSASSTLLSKPSFNLNRKWTASFTTAFKGYIPGGVTIVNEVYEWDKYRHISFAVGGLELRVYTVKNDRDATVFAYRIFMNGKEIADPYISSASMSSHSYTINYSYGSVEVIRTTDNEKIFSISGDAITALVGPTYAFNNVKISTFSMIYNQVYYWNDLSVHALEMEPAEYEITHNENGHIELYGSEFDPTSTHYIDERVTLNAVCDTYGYMFVKWVDADGNKISVNPNLDLTFTEEKTVVRAVFGPFQPYSELHINAGEGGSVLFNGAPYNFNDDYIVGDNVELSAVADEGYTFAYWMNGSNQIVSHESVMNVTLANVTEFTAYFTKSDATTATVLFYDRSGKVVSSVTVNKGESITLPALPSAYGYTCNGWIVNDAVMAAGATIIVNADTTIKADYTKNSIKYTVTVDGGTVNGDAQGTFAYNTLVTVVFDNATISDGDMFGGWHVADTASATSVISYHESYSFYVGADTDLSAIIVTSASEVKPVTDVTNVSLVSGGEMVTYLTERSVPKGYTLVESGVIYTADDNKSDMLTLENVAATVRKKAATATTPNGQFRMTLASRDGSSINVYLVSYLTYIDKAGDTHTIYSSVYSSKTTSKTDSQDKIEDSTDIF